ncbi:MAG: hypothetical protein OEW00_00240 [candidate division Zixibacteria bacterium]|nr:hypothetical protein [candidate division Zixibacteria bacterium]
MRLVSKFRIWPGVAIAGIALFAGTAQPREGDIMPTAVLFLTAINSPRANGMGGCVANLADEQSVLYNPAGLGLFHLDRVFALSLPNKTRWLPELVDDVRFKTWAISAGVSYRLLFNRPNSRFNAALSAAYSYAKFDLGTINITEPAGPEVIGTVNPYDDFKAYSIAIGFEYYVKVGLGYTHKKIKSRLLIPGAGAEVGLAEAEGKARDMGFVVRLPIRDLLPYKIYLNNSTDRYLQYELTPSFAHVRANAGDDLAYIDAAQTDALPKISRNGPSLYFGLDLVEASLVSIRYSEETERDLVRRSYKTKSKGIELGLFGFFYYRSGDYERAFDDETVSTSGYGFRLRGILGLLRALNQIETPNPIVAYVLDHLDFSYDYAKWDKDGSAVDNTEYGKMSLSF